MTNEDNYGFNIRVEEFVYEDIFSIRKEIITTKAFLPIINKDVIFEFHIATIDTEFRYKECYIADFEDYQKKCRTVSYDSKLTKQFETPEKEYHKLFKKIDYEKELEMFCPDITEQQAYYYNKVFDTNGKELPLFYGIMFGNDFTMDFIIPNNWYKTIDSKLKELVFSSKIHQTVIDNYFVITHEIGYFLYDFFNVLLNFKDTGYYCSNYKTEKEELEDKNDTLISLANDIENLNIALLPADFKNDIFNIKDRALFFYMFAIIESFLKYVSDNKILTICENCGEIFSYIRGKKYCSKECLKSSANKRNYTRRKKKNKKIKIKNK